MRDACRFTGTREGGGLRKGPRGVGDDEWKFVREED